jgi:hypothetical protein
MIIAFSIFILFSNLFILDNKYLLLMIFFMLLGLSHRDFSNDMSCIIIKNLVYP